MTDKLPDVQCNCGDLYQKDSFGAGFIAALGHCPNCQAADDSDVIEDLHVWRATTRLGQTCHFGEAGLARAWAGERGAVERIDLKPTPDLRLVESSAPIGWMPMPDAPEGMDSADGVANAALSQAAARIDEQDEEIERLRSLVNALESQLADSYANELCAMGYLSEVRAIVGGDDFPHMVERVRIETQRWKNQHERDSKELRRVCAERDQYRMRLRNLLAHDGNVGALPFADRIGPL